MDNKIPDVEEIRKIAENKKFEYRVIDYVKFNQIFNIPLEVAQTDTKIVNEKIGTIVYMSFWAWRGLMFILEKRPNEELLFTEFCSSYNVNDVTEIFNIIFGKLNEDKSGTSKNS